jgi:hypothetical protein
MKKKDIISTIFVTALVGFTIIGKLAQQQQIVDQMAVLGLTGKLQLLAAIEAVALVLYIIPRSSKLGLLLLTAYYGGAIAINLPTIVNTIPATIFLILIWLGAYVRNPKYFLN